MKKSFIALALALALCLGGVTARAESVGLGKYQGEVIARYLKQEDTIQAPAQGGKAEAELEPGTTIAAEGIPQDQGSLTLVVYPIPAGHDDAWDWFAQCMAPYGTNLYPLDIYFEDEAGNRVELDTAVTITLQTLRDYTDPILCHVASDGTVELLDSRVEGDTITFTITRGGYYVLAEKAASDDGKPTQTPSATPGVTPTATPAATASPTAVPSATAPAGTAAPSATAAPAAAVTETASPAPSSTPAPTAGAIAQTGDGSNPGLWAGLLSLSALGLLLGLLYRRKKQ